MNTKILACFIVLSLANGCKKDGLEISFDMDYSTSFTIQSNTGISLPFDFFTPDITTNSEEEFESNDTRKDKIKEILLKKLALKITAPEGRDFDFLKDINLYIRAEGLEESRYAFFENVPDGLTQLTLNSEGIDLAPYIKEDKFSLRAECVFDQTFNQDIDVTADMLFGVKANPLR